MDLRSALVDRYGPDAPSVAATEVPETIETMLLHRSHRRFRDDPVPDSTVGLILAAALSSPSKSDLQQVSVIWVQDPALRREIVALSPANSWAARAGQLLVFCADGRRIRRAAEARGRPFPNNHLDQFMNAAVDCGIALGAAVHAASSLGVGSCPISELRDRPRELGELLGLPDFVVPVAGLALGYPSEDPGVTPRLPFGVRVHRDTYSDEAFDEAADAYEERRDADEERDDSDQRMVETFGVVRPYGWAEDRTRQYSVPRRADWGAYVRGQGFGLD